MPPKTLSGCGESGGGGGGGGGGGSAGGLGTSSSRKVVGTPSDSCGNDAGGQSIHELRNERSLRCLVVKAYLNSLNWRK